jgi:hypothetical protein
LYPLPAHQSEEYFNYQIDEPNSEFSVFFFYANDGKTVHGPWNSCVSFLK